MSNEIFQFLRDSNLVEVAVITLMLFAYSSIRFSLKSGQFEQSLKELQPEV